MMLLLLPRLSGSPFYRPKPRRGNQATPLRCARRGTLGFAISMPCCWGGSCRVAPRWIEVAGSCSVAERSASASAEPCYPSRPYSQPDRNERGTSRNRHHLLRCRRALVRVMSLPASRLPCSGIRLSARNRVTSSSGCLVVTPLWLLRIGPSCWLAGWLIVIAAVGDG
jgi:hypothetical protein